MKNQTIITIMLMVVAIVVAGYTAQFWPQSDRNNTVSETEEDAFPDPIVDGVINNMEYSNSTIEVGVEVYWYNNATHLFIGLNSPGKGWVALGIDPKETHKGANYIFCNISEGVVKVLDEFGDGRYSHKPDVSLGGENNVLDFMGNENSNRTLIEFIIPLNSGDEFDTELIHDLTYEALIAYHSSNDDITQQHTNAGFIKIDIK